MKKKYILTVHPAAEMDIESSFLWGCRRWGRKKLKRGFANFGKQS